MTASSLQVLIICVVLFHWSFVLFAFSLYLIPYWKLEIIRTSPSIKEFVEVVWLTLPVLVFAFNHSPAISTFTLSVRRKYGKDSENKANQILFRTSIMLLVFVMFFVFSCIFTLDASFVKLASWSHDFAPLLFLFCFIFSC